MNKQQFDEKIDDLIQDAASNVKIAFNEAAWQKMEVLLDKKEKRRRIFYWWWLSPLALMLLGTATYFLYLPNTNLQNSEKSLLANNSLQVESNKKTLPAILKNNNNTIEQKIYNNKTIVTNKKTNSSLQEITSKEKKSITLRKGVSIANDFTSKESIAKKKNNNTALRTEVLNASKKTAPNFSYEEDRTKKEPVQKTTESETKFVNVNENNKTEKQHKTTKLTSIEKDTVATAQKKKNKDSTLTKTDSTKSIVSNILKRKTKKSVLSNFEISITGSADMTTVKFKKTDAISTAFGFGVTYFINKKISISTGIGIAKKIYNADSVDYKKISYLPWFSKLNNIAANCRVIEVPINIQYNLKAKGNTSWIAVAGISNYFMKSEDYLYEYTVSGVPKTAMYSYSNKNNHLLSIVNLAFAYRKTVNNQWSWQLASFAKIPLTGVGEGKVQLSSIGLQGSIHFKLKK